MKLDRSAIKNKVTKSLKLIDSMKERFYQLRVLMEAKLGADEFNEAKALAEEYLNLASHLKDDWNYGNAIHQANLTLGRIALNSGKLNEAKSCLLRAGNTPGSPQLNSFGPNMSLAVELLQHREIDAVLEYLDLCKKFWLADIGKSKIEDWKRTISAGKIPNFGPHLEY